MSDAPPKAELTAPELDAEIRALAAQRAATEPGHPVTPPTDASEVFQADNMLWHVRPAADLAAVELALYHPGLGWTSMYLSRAQVEDLQDAFAAALRGLKPVFNAPVTEPTR